MDDTAIREFYMKPTQIYHRQYEAIRAVIVEGRSQKEVAECFGYQYDSFRQLLCEFRRSFDAASVSTAPPFFKPSRDSAPA